MRTFKFFVLLSCSCMLLLLIGCADIQKLEKSDIETRPSSSFEPIQTHVTFETHEVGDISGITDVHDLLPTQTALPNDKPAITLPTQTSTPLLTIQHSASNTVTTQTSAPENLGDDNVNNKCRLIVKGKDITNNVYFQLDPVKKTVEIPLTAIVKELGGTVTWNDDNTVDVVYDTDRAFTFDLSEYDYGFLIPPGTVDAVRKVVEGDIIVEYETAHQYLVRGIGVTMKINYGDQIIEIL